ncbi:hypothetical protein VTN96DRAFT_3084 [Rasamsonia emersonii]
MRSLAGTLPAISPDNRIVQTVCNFPCGFAPQQLSFHGVSTNLSETIATEFDEQQHIKFDEAASNSGISQTSYAQTLFERGDGITIPPLPKEAADGNEFECPYCFFIVIIRTQREWARHIFNDLMPYICVFPDCPTPSLLYASRREWYHHLQTKHSLQSDLETKVDCPLCREGVPGIGLQRHLGRHLEELALFAIPRTNEDENYNSNASKLSGSQAGARFGGDVSDDEMSENEERSDTTHFDPEPQADLPPPESSHRTILSHVMQLRESSSSSESGEDSNNDNESIQIMVAPSTSSQDAAAEETRGTTGRLDLGYRLGEEQEENDMVMHAPSEEFIHALESLQEEMLNGLRNDLMFNISEEYARIREQIGNLLERSRRTNLQSTDTKQSSTDTAQPAFNHDTERR